MRMSLRIALAILLSMPLSGFGITINLNYRGPGQALGTYGTATAAPGNTLGAGDFQHVVETAASLWESAFQDDFELTIDYGWFPRNGATASHRFVSAGGDPYRQTRSTVAFDSDGSTQWFIDPTPSASEEFANTSTITRNFGGGVMTTGVVFNQPFGAATGHDLLSTAMHEIGHALGLSSSNLEFIAERGDNDVDVMAPLPFAGAQIPLLSSSAHIDLSNALMRSSRPSGTRRLPSHVDILANAEISTFSEINLYPIFVDQSRYDFNLDGLVDVVDLNDLLAEGPIDFGVATTARNGQFDLNGDGSIDPLDRDLWLEGAAIDNGLASAYLAADANLDGLVDASDFNAWNAGKFTANLSWSDGDFNSDGFVDASDFNIWNANKFTASDVVSVPEPNGLIVMLIAFVGRGFRKCRVTSKS